MRIKFFFIFGFLYSKIFLKFWKIPENFFLSVKKNFFFIFFYFNIKKKNFFYVPHFFHKKIFLFQFNIYKRKNKSVSIFFENIFFLIFPFIFPHFDLVEKKRKKKEIRKIRVFSIKKIFFIFSSEFYAQNIFLKFWKFPKKNFFFRFDQKNFPLSFFNVPSFF